ncbi:MAG: undecaprenyl-diphosphate phosphatase [Proteobacteria bacterium]|nr:undecaprenyl-diphosphate phosphatase [Pseudomonadota bacterium]
MNEIQPLILGMVQGITEFLPISSSAHLILTSKLLSLPDQGMHFDIAVHFGSLLAVIIYFRSYIKDMTTGSLDILCRKQTPQADLSKKLIIATIPIIIVGLLAREFIESVTRDSILIIGITSILWSIILFFADKKEEVFSGVNKITYKSAVFIGIAQAIAIIPGTSRSGSTMAIARFLKISRKTSAEFSMLMSIPAILLITGYSTCKVFFAKKIINFDLFIIFIGTATAFIFALISIHLLLKLVEKVGFLPFVIYRIILGFVIFSLIM